MRRSTTTNNILTRESLLSVRIIEMMSTSTVREQESLTMLNQKGNTAATKMAIPRTLYQLTLLSIHPMKA